MKTPLLADSCQDEQFCTIDGTFAGYLHAHCAHEPIDTMFRAVHLARKN